MHSLGMSNFDNEPRSRFDYVKYDQEATRDQAAFKVQFEALSTCVEQCLRSPRAKALVLTKLEEAYAWVGKAIRDDQIARGGSADDVPKRSNE